MLEIVAVRTWMNMVLIDYDGQMRPGARMWPKYFNIRLRRVHRERNWQLKRSDNSTETRVAHKGVACLQSPDYKSVYTESTPICSN